LEKKNEALIFIPIKTNTTTERKGEKMNIIEGVEKLIQNEKNHKAIASILNMVINQDFTPNESQNETKDVVGCVSGELQKLSAEFILKNPYVYSLDQIFVLPEKTVKGDISYVIISPKRSLNLNTQDLNLEQLSKDKDIISLYERGKIVFTCNSSFILPTFPEAKTDWKEKNTPILIDLDKKDISGCLNASPENEKTMIKNFKNIKPKNKNDKKCIVNSQKHKDGLTGFLNQRGVLVNKS
jgi:hypothetical protein